MMKALIADDGKFVSVVSILAVVLLVVGGLVVLALVPTARDGVVPAVSVGVTAISSYRIAPTATVPPGQALPL